MENIAEKLKEAQEAYREYMNNTQFTFVESVANKMREKVEYWERKLDEQQKSKLEIECHTCKKQLTIDDTKDKCGIYHQYKRNYYCIECFHTIDTNCSICGIKLKLAKGIFLFPPLEKGKNLYCSQKCIDLHRKQKGKQKENDELSYKETPIIQNEKEAENYLKSISNERNKVGMENSFIESLMKDNYLNKAPYPLSEEKLKEYLYECVQNKAKRDEES